MFHVKHERKFYKKLSGEYGTDVINYIQCIVCKTAITYLKIINVILLINDAIA